MFVTIVAVSRWRLEELQQRRRLGKHLLKSRLTTSTYSSYEYQTCRLLSATSAVSNVLVIVVIGEVWKGTALCCSSQTRMSFCLFLVTVSIDFDKTAFLNRPSLKASLEKSLNFQKLKKSLNCFWKKSGRPWKVCNLSNGKVSTRLDDCANFLS